MKKKCNRCTKDYKLKKLQKHRLVILKNEYGEVEMASKLCSDCYYELVTFVCDFIEPK